MTTLIGVDASDCGVNGVLGVLEVAVEADDVDIALLNGILRIFPLFDMPSQRVSCTTSMIILLNKYGVHTL